MVHNKHKNTINEEPNGPKFEAGPMAKFVRLRLVLAWLSKLKDGLVPHLIQAD